MDQECEYDAMIAGHVCIDIIPYFPNTGAVNISEIMRPGKLVNVRSVKISTGGPVSNTGINMKTLGKKVCFCARVGDDLLGKLIIDILDAAGNAEGIRAVSDVDSSYTIVVAPPGIDRIFLHNPGANDTFGPEDLNPDLISNCRHFHFGYPPLMKGMYLNEGQGLVQVFKIAKQAGATTSCDMSLPDPNSESGRVNWRRVLEKILPLVDIFLPSMEEAFFMLEPEKFIQMKKEYGDTELIGAFYPADYCRLADDVLAMGAKMCSLKSGCRGFYLKTAEKDTFKDMGKAQPKDFDNWANRELWAPAFEVKNFANATGSGDSSIAGFLSAYLRGLNIELALKYATCCGWQNVQALDGVSGIESWEQTAAIVQSNMPLIDINCNDEDWIFSDEYQLWAGPNDTLNCQG